MGADQADDASAEAAWPIAQDGPARGGERAFVYGLGRLRVAALPKDFPPFSTVQKYFWRWREEGLLRTIA
ncbi:hypothetical protein C5748_15845 [Phyllobacterium phragmitis]|uniref:Transposase n=1 Tax=Phyllobacterium phragmitis TaxID=2670329 RepID=A0A2S9IPW2_9HYPH|nr:hypothetical protein C5748_15845 [Phyllobacterium phragmitis]